MWVDRGRHCQFSGRSPRLLRPSPAPIRPMAAVSMSTAACRAVHGTSLGYTWHNVRQADRVFDTAVRVDIAARLELGSGSVARSAANAFDGAMASVLRRRTFFAMSARRLR